MRVLKALVKAFVVYLLASLVALVVLSALFGADAEVGGAYVGFAVGVWWFVRQLRSDSRTSPPAPSQTH